MNRLLLLLLLAAAADAQNTCIECHDAQQAPVENSAHPMLSCADCHNGDPSAAEMEASHSEAKKFIGRPQPLQLAVMCGDCHKKATDAWKLSPHIEGMLKGDPAGASCASCHTRTAAPSSHSIVDCGEGDAPTKKLNVGATCARCHGDAGQMARSGLRADAMALYAKSKHAHNVLEEKEEDGASCVDCHNAHESLRSSNPASETHVTRQSATCGRCHSDEKVMKSHGLSHGLVAKFDGSPHARTLKDGAPSCAACHGPHFARVPGFDEMGALCGRCHEGPARELAAGPHGKATWTDPQSGVASPVNCEHCHGAHGARRPEAPFAAKTCGKCHEPGTKELEAGNQISDISAKTREDLRELHQLLDKAQKRGHDLGEGCEALAALDGSIHELGSLAHGVSSENCRRVRSSFERDARELKAQLVALTPDKRPMGWLPVMWGFLFAGVALMWAKSRKSAPQA
ncbi:MAG: cytochrome c3 family protein [Planctomycetota bacterium]